MARNQKLSVDIEANDRASGKIEKVADKADKLDKKNPNVKVDANTDSAKAKLEELFSLLDDSDLPIDGLGSKLSQLASPGGAIAAVGAGLLLAGKHAADVAFEAQNIATLTGDSVEEASRLNAVWKQSGADSKDLQDVLLQMNGVLSTNADIAKTLGVNLNDGATVGERFKQVAAALDRIPDAAKRSQIASQVFGEEGVRQYNNMRNAVGDLSDALADVPEGSVIDEEDVEKAREMQEQMREVTAEFQAFATSIGTVVLPALGALFEGFNDLFEGAENLGQSVRGMFDGGEAERNRDFADSIDAAEAAARKFDMTLLDGVDSADEARKIAEEYTSTLKGNEDQLHATNSIVVEWAKSNEEAAAAQKAAEDAALLHTEAQRDQARAADHTTTVLKDNNAALDKLKGFAERAAEFVQNLGTKWDILKGKMSDRSAFLDLEDSFDSVKAAAEASWTAASEGADDAEQKARDHERSMIDLKNKVIDYGTEVGDLPDEVLTNILSLIDQGKLAEAEAALARLERARQINYYPIIQPARSPGGNDFMASGGRSAGGPTVVGERGPEIVDLPRGARVRSASETITDTRNSGSSPTFQTIIQGNVYGVDHLQQLMDERDRRLLGQLRQGRRG